jgi:hypothetical protein
MTKISDFILNTDYSTQQQLPEKYSLSLSVPAGSTSSGAQFNATINVPAGKYVENVKLTTSLRSNSMPSNYAVLGYQDYDIKLFVFQSSSTTYTLRATINPFGQTVNYPALTVNASVALSLSPFVKKTI